MRGSKVFSVILFIAGFMYLLTAVFIVINSENMSGKKAQQTAEKVLLDLANVVADNNAIKEALEKYNTANDLDYQKVMESLAKSTVENDKLNQKIQWLELKMNTAPRSTQPQKIILTQEAPLKVSMIYKKVDQKKKPVQTIQSPTREELLNKARKQVQELSK